MKYLMIDTATSNCSVAVAEDETLINVNEENEKNIHSSKLTTFIEKAVKESGLEMEDLDAVVVGKGPGSYTGLRIGVTTAKSIAYSLNIDLVAVNSLYSMAAAAQMEAMDFDAFYCPMLDARRMEVYTAVFDQYLEIKQPINAVVVDENTFKELLADNVVYFAGEGMPKCRELLNKYNNAKFLENIWPSAPYMVNVAFRKLQRSETEDVETFEPFYLKSFVANEPNKMDQVLKS